MARKLACAALVALMPVGTVQATDMLVSSQIDVAFPEDDECVQLRSPDACAFSALQRRASGALREHHAEATSSRQSAAEEPEPGVEPEPSAELEPAAQGHSDASAAVSGDDPSATWTNNSIGGEVATAATFGGCSNLAYSGPAEGAESCFCHKVGNPTCVSKPCSCREGCSGFALRGAQSSTFFNRVSSSCRGAYLTIPRAYLTDIADARNKCGGGVSSLLADMLRSGFIAYQGVQAGPVMQCIHKPGRVSVHWLHLHTFCINGKVEDLPNKGSAYCAEMHSIGDAGLIAGEWAHFR